jgi:hypothetical protein
MNNYIKKTTHTADYNLMKQDLDQLISRLGWPERSTHNNKVYPPNQIGLTYRKGAELPLLDGTGSLAVYEGDKLVSTEYEFTEWVDIAPEYTKNKILELAEKDNISIGRVRYMRLMPKTGLTVHKDFEQRYHYVFDTNPNAFFGFTTEGDVQAQCYHIPQSEHFYKIDTTIDHFVYNGGWEPRIHLVICEVK